MNKVQMDRLQGILMSLADSTDLNVHHNGVVARIWGRQSPYVSHQGIDFEVDVYHPVGHDVVAFDGNYKMVVSVWGDAKWPFGDKLDTPKDTFEAELVSAQIPFQLIESLLDDVVNRGALPWSIVAQLRERKLVYVTFQIKKVVGWTFDGRPIFNSLVIRSQRERIVKRMRETPDVMAYPGDFDEAFDVSDNEHRWMSPNFPLDVSFDDTDEQGSYGMSFSSILEARGFEEILKDARFVEMIQKIPYFGWGRDYSEIDEDEEEFQFTEEDYETLLGGDTLRKIYEADKAWKVKSSSIEEEE